MSLPLICHSHPCYRLYNVQGTQQPLSLPHPAVITMAPEQEKEIMSFWEEELAVRTNDHLYGWHQPGTRAVGAHSPESPNFEAQTQGQPAAS